MPPMDIDDDVAEAAIAVLVIAIDIAATVEVLMLLMSVILSLVRAVLGVVTVAVCRLGLLSVFQESCRNNTNQSVAYIS